MRTLNRDFKLLSQRNRDGSFATQHDREGILTMVANQLQEDGFRNLRATGMRTKHVDHLVARWQGEGISAGTLKNRMAAMRWLAEKIGKENIVARDIADRRYVTNVSKARELDDADLGKLTDPYTAMSLRLQAAFGLRREESIKIRPGWADRGDVLLLQASWTKGGKEREISIRSDAQRDLLAQAKQLAGKGSLIPSDMAYKDQLNRFKAQTARAGIDGVHGLRHAYAQARYAELTGWKAPAAGGPTSKQLSPEQKAIDRQARLTISRELGHEREQITAVYVGR
jgi:site-specific recombinase XerC